MAAQLEGPCPFCDDTGPHDVLPDVPDPQFGFRVPVVCGNCGLEFVIDTADGAPSATDREGATD